MATSPRHPLPEVDNPAGAQPGSIPPLSMSTASLQHAAQHPRTDCQLAPLHKPRRCSQAERRCAVVQELDRVMATAEALAHVHQPKKPKLLSSLASAAGQWQSKQEAPAATARTRASARVQKHAQAAAAVKQEPMPHTGKPLVRSPAVRYSGSVRQGQQQQQKQQQRQQRGASVTSGNVIRVASSSAVTGSLVARQCRRHVGLREVYAQKARAHGPNPLQPNPEEVEVEELEAGKAQATTASTHAKQLGPRLEARGSGTNWTGWLLPEEAAAHAAMQQRIAQQATQQQLLLQQQQMLVQQQQQQQNSQPGAAMGKVPLPAQQPSLAGLMPGTVAGAEDARTGGLQQQQQQQQQPQQTGLSPQKLASLVQQFPQLQQNPQLLQHLQHNPQLLQQLFAQRAQIKVQQQQQQQQQQAQQQQQQAQQQQSLQQAHPQMQQMLQMFQMQQAMGGGNPGVQQQGGQMPSSLWEDI